MPRHAPRKSTLCACGDHAFAPITGGFVTLVDPEDAHLLDAHCWHVRTDPGNSVYYVCRSRGGKTLRLHRVVMKEKDPAVFIDHRFGNGLDNRKGQLRKACVKSNGANKRVKGLKGVYLVEGLPRPYRARIMVRGKILNLGYFATEREASDAYDRAASEHFGEFAALNHYGQPQVKREGGWHALDPDRLRVLSAAGGKGLSEYEYRRQYLDAAE